MQPTLAKNTDLGTHLSDLTAFLNQFESIVSQQLDHEILGAEECHQRLHKLLKRHLGRLHAACEIYATDLQTTPKDILTNFLGAAAGLYNKHRDYPQTRALRDNYTALGMLAASYTALKTYSLMLGREDISLMAYEGLQDVCPMIIEFSNRMPEIVARETARKEGLAYDKATVDRVTNAVERCWHN